jgi:hypothetical protein
LQLRRPFLEKILPRLMLGGGRECFWRGRTGLSLWVLEFELTMKMPISNPSSLPSCFLPNKLLISPVIYKSPCPSLHPSPRSQVPYPPSISHSPSSPPIKQPVIRKPENSTGSSPRPLHPPPLCPHAGSPPLHTSRACPADLTRLYERHSYSGVQ